MTPRILIIAGSDSGGGAGIQADIKTISMLGGHAMTAVTAITAQNTVGVTAVHQVPAEVVVAQIEACLSDIGADSIKIGMIGSPETALAVSERLRGFPGPVVVDPVLVATSGAELADEETAKSLDALLALATVATPNLPELAALGGEERLLGLARAVLIKGGHGEGDEVLDRLVQRDGGECAWRAPRIDTRHTHGTGCTLASAIAVGLARGEELPRAIQRAHVFVRLALLEAPGLGAGHGPMGQQRVRLDCGEERRLNQFVLPCRDYQASLDFYRKLGLVPVVDSPGNGYARFEAPGGATVSLHGEDAGLYLECDDLEAAIVGATARGLIFEGPTDQPWLWREAWTRDPAGNRVLLYAAGEARRYPPWRV